MRQPVSAVIDFVTPSASGVCSVYLELATHYAAISDHAHLGCTGIEISHVTNHQLCAKRRKREGDAPQVRFPKG